MCSLFGLLDFEGRLTPAERLHIIRELGRASEIRGTDATGIAYVRGSSIHIQKAPRPSRRMRYRIDFGARYIMGHTRMATQGAACLNYNNHPFPGKVGKLPFALAHNGVLFNDLELRRSHELPRTIIETDSYVAVQLIEKQGELSAKSLRKMAEALGGSFTITVLDAKSNLYFIKGNNPLAVCLFPSLGAYLYASTMEILESALDKLQLVNVSRVDIAIGQGDIMKIDSTGRRIVSHFDDTNLCVREYYSYGKLWEWCGPKSNVVDNGTGDYLDEVVSYGLSRGVPERELRLLMDAGYDALDLEEMLYDPALRTQCVREIICDYGM